jgi:hypothetical protein
MDTEKRRHIRFLVLEDVFISIQNGAGKIGRVKNISMGGLSFEHIYDEELNWVQSRRNIFLWINDFNFKVPCKIIYDIPVSQPPEYDGLIIQLTTRLCGVQFETLTDDQLEKLNFFLKNYTKGKA